MADKKLPFLMKTYPCPACGAPASHRQFRSRTFSPGKVESDNHVLTYTWSDPQFLQVHPPLYYLYFCTSCFFTTSSESYVDPSGVLYGRAGTRAFLAARSQNDRVIDLLGRRIDYSAITFESALWMHLLAIYEQLLREEPLRDHYTIARFYLRAAWLYREESAARTTQSGAAAKESPDDITQRAALEALREFDAVLHQCHEGRDRILATLKADEARRGESDSAVYEKALGNMARLFEALHSEAYRIKSTFNLSYVSELESGDRSFSTAFLDEVKSLWVYAPAEETEALRSAVEHFEKAIASDARLNEPDRFLRTSALIVDLELRCNDLDAAFKKVRGVVASVMKDRQAIAMRIKEEENPSHKVELHKRLVAANRAIERANDLHGEIVELVIEREMPRIVTILQDHARGTVGQKKVALLANGISHGLIHHLEERKLL